MNSNCGVINFSYDRINNKITPEQLKKWGDSDKVRNFVKIDGEFSQIITGIKNG